MSHQFHEEWSGLSFQKALKRKCLGASSFLSAFEMNTLIEGISVFWSSPASASELLGNPEALLHSRAALHSGVQFRTHPGNGAPVNGSGKCLTLQNCGFRFFLFFFFHITGLLLLFPVNLGPFTERFFFFSLLRGRRCQCWHTALVHIFNSVLQRILFITEQWEQER